MMYKEIAMKRFHGLSVWSGLILLLSVLLLVSCNPADPPATDTGTEGLPPSDSSPVGTAGETTPATTDRETESSVPTVTLTFSPDVAGMDARTVSVPQDAATVQLPADPERAGYAFKGWYTEKDGQGLRVTAATPLDGEAVYHARWVPYEPREGRNMIRIGGFNGITESHAVESDFAALAECGVDEIYMTFFHDDSEDGVYTLEKSMQYIRWMEKYGIRSWINDFKLNDLLIRHAPREEIEKLLAVYRDSPAFAGNYMADEPSGDRFDDLRKGVMYYREILPDHEMYINLFPNFAPPSAFIDGSYEEYIRLFTETFPLSYVSQDFYPINMVGKKKTIAKEYYSSLYTTAKAAKKTQKEHWMYIYTMRDTVNAIKDYEPSLSDVRYEAFTAMAYGCNSISYYCFDCPPSYAKSDSFGMLKNHEKTPLFDVGKQVTAEIKALSECFPNYLWQDTCYFGQSRRFTRDVGQVLSPITEVPAIQLEADKDLLIGCFEEAGGDGEAYMIVNHADRNHDDETATATVTLTIPGALKATAHIGTGQTVLTPDADGRYTVTLLSGQGCFLEIEK